jgi:hypothetical protein
MEGNLTTNPTPGQVLVGQPNMGYEPRTMSGDATIDENGVVTVSGGGGSGISGLTDGFVPLAGSATTINRDSPIDFDVTQADIITVQSPVKIIAPILDTQGAGLDVESSVAPVGATISPSSSLYVQLDVDADGTTDIDTAMAIDAEIYNISATKSVNILRCCYFYVGNQGSGAVNQLTTVTIDTPDVNGPVTELTGLEINDQQGGTTNYAIRTGKGVVQFGDIVRSGVIYSVAGTPLPSAATAGVGARAFVSDATANTFNTVYAGSSTNKVPVFSDGTNWRIG